MNRLLLCIFLIFLHWPLTSRVIICLLKRGSIKKRRNSEGDRIYVQLQNGQNKKGTITMLRDNIVYIKDTPIPKEKIAMVILDGKGKKSFPAAFKTML